MTVKIINNQEDLNYIVNRLNNFKLKSPLVMSIEKLADNTKQLKSYWMLIEVCKNFMNEKGNNFTKEQVDYYFRMKAKHYTDIDGIIVIKSISKRNGATKEEMTNLINTILDFGKQNQIKDCEIISPYLRDLLKNY